MSELSHIDMLHRSVNLDLTHQLLLCSTSLETGLLNDFCSSDCFIVTLNEFITFSKATFSQEFSFDVLPIANFTVLVFNSFLYDLALSLLLRMEVGLTASVSTSR